MSVMEGIAEMRVLDVLHGAHDPTDHALAKGASGYDGVLGDADLARGEDAEVENGVGEAGGGRSDLVAYIRGRYFRQRRLLEPAGDSSPFLISPSTTAISETTPRNES
jgi:hypothetical protein